MLDQRIELVTASDQVDDVSVERPQRLEQELAAAKARIQELESERRLREDMEAEASVDYGESDCAQTFLRTASPSQASLVAAPIGVCH